MIIFKHFQSKYSESKNDVLQTSQISKKAKFLKF